MIFLYYFVTLTHFVDCIIRKDYIEILFFNGTILSGRFSGVSLPANLKTLFLSEGHLIRNLKIENTDIKELNSNTFKSLPNIQDLTVHYNKQLEKIGEFTFKLNSHIYYLNLKHNNIRHVEDRAFAGLFKNKNTIGKLFINGNKLTNVPTFSNPSEGIKILDVSGNPIKKIDTSTFRNVPSIQRLFLRDTDIDEIPEDTFQKFPNLHVLDLSGNRLLQEIHDGAFSGEHDITTLKLSGSLIERIPYEGLGGLKTLEISNTPNVFDLSDGLLALPSLKTVIVGDNQRFLCCAFEAKRARFGTFIEDLDGKTTDLCKQKTATSTPTASSTTGKSTGSSFNLNGFSRKRRAANFLGGFVTKNSTSKSTKTRTGRVASIDGFLPGPPKNISEGHVICPNRSREFHSNKLSEVTCLPRPDALRPCDDVMGNVFLTSLSWVIAVIALTGNSVVFCVLMCSRRSMTVTKFLLLNLSFADLCLSLYLFLLVSASSHTHGEYYNYVRQWQYQGGCSISGFLAIFSAQLSMLVLIVITVERYFAIVHAMHFHRRVTMFHAKIAIALCWFYALVMALLPLLGVNSYEEVAICLPFRHRSATDLAYIGFLLIMNVVFFGFVLVSYIRMYLVVKSPHLECGPQRSDSEVAKRMALLVFSDFFCWAPIAFIGLASAFKGESAFGIDVKKSKYLLVIFYPINALCNPFLYAVSTNSFRRDFFDLMIRCGIFEESVSKANEALYSNRDRASLNNFSSETASVNISRNSPRASFSRAQQHKTGLLSRVFKTQTSASEKPLLMTSKSIDKQRHDLLQTVDKLDANTFQEKVIRKLSEQVDKNKQRKLMSMESCDESVAIPTVVARERFSHYDLTPETVRAAKETDGL